MASYATQDGILCRLGTCVQVRRFKSGEAEVVVWRVRETGEMVTPYVRAGWEGCVPPVGRKRKEVLPVKGEPPLQFFCRK